MKRLKRNKNYEMAKKRNNRINNKKSVNRERN